MPGSGFTTFTDGQVLTAAQVNGYLQKQAVMYFATSAARSAAITAPETGMVTYRADGVVLEYYNGTTWVAMTDVNTSQVLTNKIFQNSEERWNVVAAASTGTINFDYNTSAVWYYTTSATANWTLNFRGSSTATLSSLLSVGDSVTVVFAAAQGVTAYRPTVFQIDTAAVTPIWQGGAAPTAGNASSTDVYSFVILKTAATPTYTVFASQTQFK